VTRVADYSARGRWGGEKAPKKHGGEALEKYLLTTSASIHGGSEQF
jgi:hypothetical protein